MKSKHTRECCRAIYINRYKQKIQKKGIQIKDMKSQEQTNTIKIKLNLSIVDIQAMLA